MEKVKSGHIGMPLNALVSTYGGQPTEAVLRGMLYAGRLERQYNVRFPIAIAMENQVMPYGLGALWAGSGARYTWKGICGCVSKVPDAGDRKYDIYWWQGPDGSRILTKWNSMLNGNTSMGGYAEARDPASTVAYVDTNSSFQARYPYGVIGAFGKGWDDLKTLTSEFVSTAKTLTDSTQSIYVSNQLDFFQDFESSFGNDLPTQAVTYGNEWDLYCASLADVTASVRRAVEKLRGAEAMATLVNLRTADFMSTRTDARDQAWMDLGLYWEHDWTADGAISRDAREAWQRKIATNITSYVDDLHEDARNALGGLIDAQGSTQRFFVFNPLGWTRTDMVDLPYTPGGTVHVTDLVSGQDVPSQNVTVGGKTALRILASDLPAVGYRVYEVRTGSGTTFTDAASVSGSTLENSLVKLSVADRGAITSLIDKARGSRELAQTVNGRQINDLGSSTGSLSVENAGPVSVTLKASGDGPIAHVSRVTLIRGLDRVAIQNELTENFSSVSTWGYGFKLTNPTTRHGELGAILTARLDSNGGQYSSRNARYDYLTFNHFADMADATGGYGITLAGLDTPFFQLGASTTSTLDTTTPSLNPLAGGQVDGTNLGIQGQGGDSYFRQDFALRPHGGYDATAAMKFAMEAQNPPIAGVASGNSSGYPATSWSMLSVSDLDVLLMSIKPAEDGIGSGVVARIWNVGTTTSTTLDFASNILEASQVTHVETPIATLAPSNGNLVVNSTAGKIDSYLLGLEGAPDDPTPTPTPTPTPPPGDDGSDGCTRPLGTRMHLSSGGGAGVVPVGGLLAVLIWLKRRRAR
jgi:alpha-mannosidase